MKVTVRKLLRVLKIKSHEIFQKPYELNIVGIRSPETNANRFDDQLHVFFKDAQNKWKHFEYQITTDPGTYFLKNPLQVDGTAILKAGQYKNAYQLGLHRKQYKALVQTGGKVTVIRDYDRNAILDFLNGTETAGWYGINIHRAKPKGATGIVDKWSAGCQVFQDADDFEEFMRLCEMHRLYNGNKFTYTLIDLRSLVRYGRRWWIIGVLSAMLAAEGAVLLLTQQMTNGKNN